MWTPRRFEEFPEGVVRLVAQARLPRAAGNFLETVSLPLRPRGRMTPHRTMASDLRQAEAGEQSDARARRIEPSVARRSGPGDPGNRQESPRGQSERSTVRSPGGPRTHNQSSWMEMSS